MASITCTKCGATLKIKAPVAPGKKMKCPKCEKVFVVEDEEEELEEEKVAEEEGAGTEDEEEEDEAAEKLRKKEKKAPAKKGGSMILILGGVAVLFLCLVSGGGGFAGWYFFLRDKGENKDQFVRKQDPAPIDKDKKSDPDGKKDKTEPEKKKEEGPKPDFTATAEDLARELRDQRKATVAKYNGKRLEVTGEVEYRGPGGFNLQGVLGKNDYPINVSCDTAPKDDARVNSLSRKQKVKVVGKAEVRGSDLQFILRDSTFVELEPSKLVKMTAAEAAKILDEGGMLLAKPREHGVLLSGTVLDVVQNKNNPGEYFVYLDAPGPKRMAVSLIPGKKENLPAKGKTIEASLWDELRENPESNARSTLAYLVSVK